MGSERVSQDATNVDLRTFREAVNSAGHSIYWTNIDGTIEYVNEAFQAQTGYTAEEAIGNNANILQSGAHDDRFYERLWDTILRGEVWNGEIVNKRKNGTRYVVKQTISPITDDDGTIVRFVAVNEDITELRESKARLETERDRFASLLNAVPVPLVLVSFDADDPVVKRVNRAFERKFDIDESRIVGSSLDDRIRTDPDSDQAQEINETLQRGDSVSREVTRRTANGTDRTFLLEATPLQGTDGREALGTYIDITDRKDAEETVRRKNEQLEEFANVISHDLRNPLNVAIGHRELASEACDSSHLDAVATAHSRMSELIDNTLMLARQGKAVDELEPIDLDACVRRSWKTVVTSGASVTIEVTHTIRGDESRVRQLFGNLFRNAIEHGGGDVHVSVGDLDDGFFVADDGPGIPDTERGTVFDSGYTTRESGTGFGLSIVGDIVDAHEWSITVTESDDGGARFEITDVDVLDG